MRQTSEPRGLETLVSRIRWMIGEKLLKPSRLGQSPWNQHKLCLSADHGYSTEWVLTGERSENVEIAYRDLKSDTI